jgi:tRNA modification GTPase
VSPSTSDTIVAASSPAGRSARGLVRLSGPACGEILRHLGLPSLEPRTLTPAAIHLPPRLPVLAACFAAPASYTGQDMAELQLPGHPALLERVIHRCVEHGARLAEPGEFTFRAFLAGKLDLTQAEGIAATIAAQSEGQLQAAALLTRGHLGQLAHRWVDHLADTLALVEAGIDFTDQEDVVPIGPDALADRLAAAQRELEQLLSRSRSWGALEALPRVVLVGAPSTGKSTLFNALLGRTRAVVSALPGTTRDILAEPLALRQNGGPAVEIMLLDIAGLDTPQGALDQAVQSAARQAIDSADLLLAVHDHEQPPPPPTPGKPTLTVRTKADLPPTTTSNPAARVPHAGSATCGSTPDSRPSHTSPEAGRGVAPGGNDRSARGLAISSDVAVSVHDNRGLDALRDAIALHVGRRGVSVQSDLLALQPRHQAALRAALEQVRDAAARVEPQRERHALASVELIAAALRAALDELANLGGRMTPDDIIGRVFATFCVGK